MRRIKHLQVMVGMRRVKYMYVMDAQFSTTNTTPLFPRLSCHQRVPMFCSVGFLDGLGYCQSPRSWTFWAPHFLGFIGPFLQWCGTIARVALIAVGPFGNLGRAAKDFLGEHMGGMPPEKAAKARLRVSLGAQASSPRRGRPTWTSSHARRRGRPPWTPGGPRGRGPEHKVERPCR